VVGADCLDSKEEGMESLKFSSVCIDINSNTRDMDNAAAEVLMWEESTILQQPGGCGIFQRGFTHIQSIANSMCCAKHNCFCYCFSLIGEDRGM